MQLNDKTLVKGQFELVVKDKSGAVLEKYTDKNLIVNGAKNQLARLISGNGANRHITQIGFGTGTSPASPNNTALTAGFFKPITAAGYPQNGQASFSWSLSTTEGNGMAITEFGLRCADGTLFAKKVRAAINKSDDISITGTWTIIF